MSVGQAALLGVVQGLTEFLPVSSSGHLVLMQAAMKSFEQPGVVLDVVLHAGTTLAVLVFFWGRIIQLRGRELLLIGIGTVPVVLVGLALRPFVEVLFGSVRLVGAALMVTAVLNFLTDRMIARREKMGKVDAGLVGIAQAIALVPGISRSGITIFAGTSMGVERRQAAEFSFLLSVPAIVGANVLELMTHGLGDSVPVVSYAVGFGCAFGAALVAIGVVLRMLVERRFLVFAGYCAVLGVVALLLV